MPDTAPAARSRPGLMPNGTGCPPSAPAGPRRRNHARSAAKARIVVPTTARTRTGSARRKARRPSGNPARQPSPSRNSSLGAIARHNPGSTTSDSAVVMMMTGWIAHGGSTNNRKSGVARTAKPKPLAACSNAAPAVVAASPTQSTSSTCWTERLVRGSCVRVRRVAPAADRCGRRKRPQSSRPDSRSRNGRQTHERRRHRRNRARGRH